MGDTKASFNQAALDISMYSIDNFNKIFIEVTKPTFPTLVFCKEKKILAQVRK